jgi:hypothetical protein
VSCKNPLVGDPFLLAVHEILHNGFERKGAINSPPYVVAQHDVPLPPFIGKLRNSGSNITRFCYLLLNFSVMYRFHPKRRAPQHVSRATARQRAPFDPTAPERPDIHLKGHTGRATVCNSAYYRHFRNEAYSEPVIVFINSVLV